MEKEMIFALSNEKFMDWVISKLNSKYFIDDHNKDLDDNDKFYAKMLRSLFQLVEEFANNSNINPTRLNEYDVYYVEYKGSVFFVYEGPHSYGCFKNTLAKKDIPYCFNFEDIRKSKIDDLIDSDNVLFKGLKEEIVKLDNKGVPLSYICQIVNRIVYKVNNAEKGYTYQKK